MGGGRIVRGEAQNLSYERMEHIRQVLRLMDNEISSCKTATYMNDKEELKRNLENLCGSFTKWIESEGFFNKVLEEYFE